MKNKKIIILTIFLIIIVVLGFIGILISSSESKEVIISKSQYTLLDNGYYVWDGKTYNNEDIDKVNDNEYKLDDKNRILKLNFKDDTTQKYFNITYGKDVITSKSVTKNISDKNSSTIINEYKITDYADKNSKLISKVERNFSSIIDNKLSKIPENIAYYYNNKNQISKIVSSAVSNDSISETIYTFDYFNYNNKSIVCEKSKSYSNDKISKLTNTRNDGLMEETTTIYYEDDMKKDILSQLGIGCTRLYNNIIEENNNGEHNYSRYETDKIIYYKEISYNKLVRDRQVEHTYIYNNDDFEGFLEKKQTFNSTTLSIENNQKDYSIYKKNNKFYYLYDYNQEKIKQGIDALNKDRKDKDKIELSSDIKYAQVIEYDFSDKNEIIVNIKLISKDSSLYKEISKFKYDEKETNKLIQFVLNSNTEANVDYKSIDYKKEPIKYLEAYLLGLNKISRDTYIIFDEGKASENPNHILYHIMCKTGGTIGWYVLDKTNGNIIDYMNDYLEDDVDYDTDFEIDEPIIPDSSNRYIDENIISCMDSQRLRLARNEIYARHGCQFKDKELQAYFESKSWYCNLGYTTGEVEGMLNEIEKANIQTISDYENSY